MKIKKEEISSHIFKFLNNWNGHFDLQGPSDKLDEFYHSLYTSIYTEFINRYGPLNNIGWHIHREFKKFPQGLA